MHAFSNARVFAPQGWARSLLIDDGGRIAAVSRDNDAWPGVRSVDLEGRLLLPGVVDAHVHLRQLADRRRALTFTGRESAEELVQAVGRRATKLPAGTWIVGYGYDDSAWAGTAVSRGVLDAAAPLHAVFLRRKDAHSGLANTWALRRAGIPEDVSDPEGGQFERDAQGRLTGLIKENAQRPILTAIPVPSGAELEALLLDALQGLARMGLTTVCTIGDQAEFAALQTLQQRQVLPIRVCQFLPSECLEGVRSAGLRSGIGVSRIWFGGVKFFVDGSLGSRTALLEEPYEGTDDEGLPIIDPAELEHGIRSANSAGVATAVHAIGDRALRIALDALEATRREALRLEELGFRNRIEHAQLGNPQQFARMARLGVIASMQPLHALADWVLAERCWGSRCQYAYAWRQILDAGVRLAFGSDAPVESADPLLGLRAAVTRQDIEGQPKGGWYPQQCLSLDEALAGYGRGAAQAVGRADQIGSLKIGQWADLVILNEDPVTAMAKVEAVYVAGGREAGLE